MHDVELLLPDRPGALASMGETLGRAGVSIEGGGSFVVDGVGIGHFLFVDGHAAARALVASGFQVTAVREVIVQRLRQGEPGQLGSLCRQMADAGVNIRVQYSDHANQLILVVDDVERGRHASEAWRVPHAHTG